MLVDWVFTDADPICACVVELFWPDTVKLRVVVLVLHSKVPCVTVFPSLLSILNFSVPVLFLTIKVLSKPLKVTLSVNVAIPSCVGTWTYIIPEVGEIIKFFPETVVNVLPPKIKSSI